MIHRVSDIMNDESFMNLYIYQMFHNPTGVGLIWGVKLAEFLAWYVMT